MAAGLIVFVVIVFAAGFGLRQAHITQTLEAEVLASVPEHEAIVYWSLHGAWPSPGRSPADDTAGGLYVKRLGLDHGGGITTTLEFMPIAATGTPDEASHHANNGGLLSLRPELLGSRDAPAVVWLCGYAVAQGRIQAVNRTTLARQVLPPTCR